MDLAMPLAGVSKIGPSFLYKLERLNLRTVGDLITHYPFRYDDFSNVTSGLEAKIGERVTLQGEIWSIKNVYTRSRKIITQAVFNDGTSPIELTWFNQSWLVKQIMPGDRLQISGKVNKFKNKISIAAPVWEKIGETRDQKPVVSKDTLHTGRLVPVYPETFGLTSKWLRAKIDELLPKVLNQVTDPLPESIRDGMIELAEALKKIHFPPSWEDVFKAKERLSFDELFFIQLATQKTRLSWQNKRSVKPLEIDLAKLEAFSEELPFKLTKAQRKVISEILGDLYKEHPMNRLVQGEVGSGKTVVAAVIMYAVFLNNLRSVLMTPTEILAFQHYSTISNLLEPLGVRVGIYTGSRKEVNGLSDVIIGTHALLSDKLTVDNIGLVVVDEQQRFGVEQRTILRNRAEVPHFLTMTATPIPRTVALTLYGDLDLSLIDELPKGRKQVKTYFVPGKKRGDAYKFIEKKVQEGDQVYIITPLIEESETLVTAKAAKVEFDRLKRQIFPKLRLGLLHGRLKSVEKNKVLNDFKDHNLDILVSTSVVEVGVDVANATMMVIEGAERFGLAQLHQLRGRVGRGVKESYCLLFSESEESAIVSRLKNLERIHNGMELSELDLKIRGSGQVFGTAQSGRWELKIASFSDLSLIEKTREGAKNILQESPKLDKYPKLQAKLDELAGKEVSPD